MAGAMHKMAVYLGLVEEDRRYDDGYDSYEEYSEYEEQPEELPGEPAGQANLLAGDMGTAAAHPAGTTVQATDLTRITTLHPRTYNEARTIGEHFREGTPVIMNLTEMVDSDAKRLVRLRGGPDLRPPGQYRTGDQQGVPAVTGEHRGHGRGQGADGGTRVLQPELGTP